MGAGGLFWRSQPLFHGPRVQYEKELAKVRQSMSKPPPLEIPETPNAGLMVRIELRLSPSVRRFPILDHPQLSRMNTLHDVNSTSRPLLLQECADQIDALMNAREAKTNEKEERIRYLAEVKSPPYDVKSHRITSQSPHSTRPWHWQQALVRTSRTACLHPVKHSHRALANPSLLHAPTNREYVVASAPA
eukprot:1194393-Prorocentrum_minimum.AAC.5